METYTVKRLGKNVREVHIPDRKATILISYTVPVGIKYLDGIWERTSTRWSRSTESQIRKFWGGNFARLVDQAHIDSFLARITGDDRLAKTRDVSKEAPRARTRGINYQAYTEQGDSNLVVPVSRRRR